MKRTFVSGTTRSLGDLRLPWLLTTYKSRDDPPSGFREETPWGFPVVSGCGRKGNIPILSCTYRSRVISLQPTLALREMLG